MNAFLPGLQSHPPAGNMPFPGTTTTANTKFQPVHGSCAMAVQQTQPVVKITEPEGPALLAATAIQPSTSSTDSEQKPRRTVYSNVQLAGFEAKYAEKKNLSYAERLELAEKLGVTQIQVRVWFQNRREKDHKQDRAKKRPKDNAYEEADDPERPVKKKSKKRK